MKKALSIITIGLLLIITGCTDNKETLAELWAMAFSTNSLTLELGDDPVALTLSFYPTACEEEYTVEIVPDGIVNFENGIVTAIAAGEAVITATSVSGVKAACLVKVTEPVVMDPPYGKKGACFNFTRYSDWPSRVYQLKPFWFYCWNPSYPTVNLPENVEWVPIINNKNQLTDENLLSVKNLVAEGKAKYLLGFNEPDLESQANMTVSEAIAEWPKLESIGIPLGSPAISNGAKGKAWLSDFMSQAKQSKRRVDFICVHWYGGPNAAAFKDYVTSIHDAYRLPIWVTEFGVADYSAQTPESNKYPAAQVQAFMQEVLPFLDQTSWIHRYSWFTSASMSHQYTATCSLFDNDSKLTDLGEFYSSFVPNNDIVAPYVEPERENILVNGNFESGIEPWEGVNCDQSKVLVYEGEFSGRIMPRLGSIFQIVEVKPGDKLLLSGKYAWKSPTTVQGITDATLFIKEESNEGTVITSTTLTGSAQESWKGFELEFTVPQNVTKICVQFSKPQLGEGDKNSPALFVDDIKLLR